MEGRVSAERFFLFANPEKPETVPTVRELVLTLMQKGCVAVLDDWLHDLIQIGEPKGKASLDSSISAVISIGGDGTLLRILPDAAIKGIPVLGVNMGHTGFLLETDRDDLLLMTDLLINKNYTIEERMMLRCSVNGTFSSLAMNEVALTRGHNPSSLVVDVMAGDELVYSIHGDGVLVSTPSGTTAYALAAGGPVIHPALACLVIVPICSHIMHQRPVVLPDQSVVSFTVRANHGKMHQISIDGQIVLDLTSDTIAIVSKAAETARFIRFGRQRFLTRLRQKQMEWSNQVYGGKL